MQLNEPFISIIVPVYNRGHLIENTLRSLQKQDYDKYEIIVVDDGSTDNTKMIVTALLDEKTRYVYKPNGERGAARNHGLNFAGGAYVNFFDSDDIALPNHLSAAASLIAEKGTVEWFHLAYSWADETGKVFRETNKFSGTTLNHLICTGNPLSCNGVFIREDVIKKNRFNEDRRLAASEDYELWCRLASRYPLYYSNTITSTIIEHNGRSVRNINGEKLVQRLQALIYYLEQDETVQKYFGKDFSKIKMDANSYLALHLAEVPRYKLKSIAFLIISLGNSLTLLKNKRFYAIIKNILFKW